TAALGSAQLDKVDKILAMRRDIAGFYDKELSAIEDIQVPVERKGCYNVYQLYTISLSSHEKRDSMKKALEDKRIMSKVYFDPIHLTEFYRGKGYGNGNLPQTETVARRVLTLPLYPQIGDEEKTYVVESIRDFMNR
ncbi:MAG: DegT/DnrJ/EryC1/StrS family aminotransferase, partial [Thermoplasmata archaeon]|nr:DegT/DnrJ/EryC1/StrS family aminotransferase [Thermoplasmata archaeon]